MWPFKKKIKTAKEEVILFCRHCGEKIEKHVFPNGQYTWVHVYGGFMCGYGDIKTIKHAEPK